MRVLILILTFLYAFILPASEVGYYIRSPKALLMGDAFTASGDDEFAVFYNPATLGNARLIEFSLINPVLHGPNLLSNIDDYDSLPRSASEIAQKFANTPVIIQATGGPMLKFGPMGFGFIANMKTDLNIRNAIYPQLELNYLFDKGFILSYAYTKGRGGKYEKYNPYKRKKVSTSGYRFSMGASAKYKDRSALSGTFSMFGTRLLNIITSGAQDITELRKDLGYGHGTAWGADIGMTMLYSTGRSEFVFGLSVLDLAGTNFKQKTEGIAVPEQEMIISSGISFSQNLPVLSYRLSVDLHPINSGYDFLRKLHIGGELNLVGLSPLLDIFVGYNSGYFSYGLELNLALFRITAGFYGVELGTAYREDEGQRIVAQISIFDFAYDI